MLYEESPIKCDARGRLNDSTARGYLKASPKATMISVSQNDNLNQCADAAELAVVKAEGSPGGPMFRAINTVSW